MNVLDLMKDLDDKKILIKGFNVDNDKKAIELLGTKFVESNSIEGLSNTEFKYEEATGKYYFIETNARVWQQIELPDGKHNNFASSYFNLLTKNILEHHKQSNLGLIWVDYPTLLLLFLRKRREIKLTFFQFLKISIFARNYGLLSLFDIKPFLKDLKIIH